MLLLLLRCWLLLLLTAGVCCAYSYRKPAVALWQRGDGHCSTAAKAAVFVRLDPNAPAMPWCP